MSITFLVISVPVKPNYNVGIYSWGKAKFIKHFRMFRFELENAKGQFNLDKCNSSVKIHSKIQDETLFQIFGSFFSNFIAKKKLENSNKM